MAAAIRHIWGPYRSVSDDRNTDKNPRIFDPRWYFHGIRSDGRISSWILTFDIANRRWWAHGVSSGKDPLPDRVVDLLRARLSPDDFARVTRLIIAAGG